MRPIGHVTVLCLVASAVACGSGDGLAESPASPPPAEPADATPAAAAQAEASPSASAALLEPERVVRGDVADWPGSWSPDSRFYVFFHWRADAPCTGESVFAYDFKLNREIHLSSEDYCTREVDPDQIWQGDSTLLLGDGPDGTRWEAVSLGDEVIRTTLENPPATCSDRGITLPPALAGLVASRALWSPDEAWLALAVVPEDEAERFEDIPGNRPDRHLFQRLRLGIFPADGADESALRWLGPLFDLGPDSLGPDDAEEGCPGTHLRWSDDGALLIASMGPFVYKAASGQAWLAPAGPNSGPLGPDVRWSPDDRRAADDRIVLDLSNGEQYEPPGILPGYDRGFAGSDRFVYVNEGGLVAYDIANGLTRQLTDFRKAVFVVAPDGSRLVYAENGDLWALDLPE